MPYDLQTPFGTRHGQLTPAEMQMGALRRVLPPDGESRPAPEAGSLADDPFFAEQGPSANTLASQARNQMVDQRQQRERLMDRSAANASGIPEAGSRADVGDWRGERQADIGANLARLQGEQQQSALQNEILKKVGGSVMGGAGGAPAAGGGDDSRALMDMLIALKGGTPPDREQQKFDRGLAQQKANTEAQLAQMQVDAAKRAVGRENDLNDFNAGNAPAGKTPMALDQFLPQSGLGANLEQMAGAFGERDAKMFGWDPTEQDVQDILRERDTVVRSLKQRGYDEKSAREAANRQIQMKLAPNQHDVNTGWIKQLRGSL